MKKVGLLVILFILAYSSIPLNKAEARTFPDVTQYEAEINFLVDRTIIRGYEDGAFKPTNPLTRLQAVQMLLKAKGITDLTAPDPNLTDMFPGKYGYAEVAKAVQLGIISGKTAKDGTKYFDPTNYLTRGQMAKVIVEADNLPMTRTSFFLDVEPSNGFHDYISTLATEGITGGYEDGTYKPTNTVSRQHFAVFVARMLDEQFKPTEINKGPSFILNKANMYTWAYYDNGEVIEATLVNSTLGYKGISGWDLWREAVGDSVGYLIVREDDKGLFEMTCRVVEEIVCEPLDDMISPALEYPLHVGKKWGSIQNVYDSAVYTVVSTNRTMTTKAGTFKYVVEVKDTDGWTYFYAPNVGLVKTIDNGVTFAELVKLQ